MMVMGKKSGYSQKLEADMTLIRSRQALAEIVVAYQEGSPEKVLRSYFLPAYQVDVIDLLAKDTGLSKGAVVRNIIDEWYAARVARVEAG